MCISKENEKVTQYIPKAKFLNIFFYIAFERTVYDNG